MPLQSMGHSARMQDNSFSCFAALLEYKQTCIFIDAAAGLASASSMNVGNGY